MIFFIFIILIFSFFANVSQIKAQPLTNDQMECYLSGGDANDPMYKKYFDICWKKTGAKSTGAIINCMNTYPEFVEWDNKNKENCSASSPSPSPSGLSTEDYLNCINGVVTEFLRPREECLDKAGAGFDKWGSRITTKTSGKCYEMLIDEEAQEKEIKRRCGDGISTQQGTSPQPSPMTDTQAPYAACAWDCADQVEAKYQCPFEGPLDSCVTDKMSYQSVCQNYCWDSWRLPPETKASEGGAQIKKIEQNGKTALLVVGHDRSVSDSVMEEMQDEMADWDPNDNQLNIPIQTARVPLGLGVLSLDGDVDIKRPGSNFWEPLREGTAIPEGSQVFTGIDGNVWIYGKFGIANISHGSYVTINRSSASQGNDPNVRFDIKVGKVEIRYEKANYQGVIQTRTPSATARVKGTKFYTSYNQKQRYSTIGVYEGQVEVQSLITGEKIELSSVNDNRQDLAFVPLQQPKEENREQAYVKQENQKQKSSTKIFVPVVVILGLMATALILYKKGKLLALYKTLGQKVSGITKKINKKTEEKKT